MILAPRKHLFATNIIFFCLIFILQKLIKLFCIIERKATCSNSNCTTPQRCGARCTISDNNNHCNGHNQHNSSNNNNYNNNNKRHITSKKHGRTTDHAPSACVHVNTLRRSTLKRIAESDDEGAQPINAGSGSGGGGSSGSGSGSVSAACALACMPPRRSMLLRMFGYGEGHYQLFVEDKQRNKEPSKACLNAAVAELKLNPN